MTDAGKEDAEMTDTLPACQADEFVCRGNEMHRCKNGSFVLSETCSEICVAELGCVSCAPGTGICEDGKSRPCLADGLGFGPAKECDEKMGLVCGESGLCEGACGDAILESSYIGCEYYPTVTGNSVRTDHFNFAVAVANASEQMAEIHIEGGALPSPLTSSVAPGAVAVIDLPWVEELKTCMGAKSGFVCTPKKREKAFWLREAPIIFVPRVR